MKFKQRLKSQEGYVVIPNLIPSHLIDKFVTRLNELYPVRASSSKKIYAEKEDIKKLPDIAVWWSQTVNHYPEVKEIENILTGVVKKNFPTFEMYACDTVTINPGSTWVNPHVDTPHRFSKWNFDKTLLGLQCIIPLFDLNTTNGSTGLLPFSQKKDFDINLCYKDCYTRYFLENSIQPDMNKGSALIYNCRVLHSSMPNETTSARPALLINYLDSSIIEDVRKLDNIWQSNG